MKYTFETLPNEILIIVFSYLSWLEMLDSLWSLNNRINNLICSVVSINNAKRKNGIIIKESGLSYNKCYSKFFSLLNHSSSLSFCSSIRNMCFDGTNSMACDINYEWVFQNNNEKKILRFPNLKSLTIAQCWLSESLIENLSLLIQNQLEDLTLIFDTEMFNSFRYGMRVLKENYKRNILNILKRFLRQLFSSQCQLNFLRLDIGNYGIGYNIDECTELFSHSFQNSIFNEFQSSCATLSRLYIHIKFTYFLENLIEHTPALERLSIKFNKTLNIEPRSASFIEKLSQSNGDWCNKVPKLRYFTLKTFIRNDLEFVYLKWLLNNINHVKSLKVHLGSGSWYGTNQTIWKSFIDADFVRQYCLPDIITNIIDFNFYICSLCQVLSTDTGKIINSFQFHPLFINRQWTNVRYFYDPIISYQHLFSTNVNTTLQFFNGLVNYPYLFQWPNIRHISINFHPLPYIFLEELDQIFPNVSFVTVHMESYTIRDDSNPQVSLTKPFETGLNKMTDIQLRNITKLKFGYHFTRTVYSCDESIDQNTERAKILAQLISMPVQLKHLLIENFEWLLHIIEYASNQLKKDALITVRYIEFGIPSCHRGSNESVNIGKHLVPVLKIYMPNLHTLRLWRPDDFPWTTVRPDLPEGHIIRMVLRERWMKSLHTSESIAQQVTIFEQDLCQLVEQLKQFVFLDIYGLTSYEKVEAYHSMVKTRFPNSRNHVDISRFSLWL